MSRLSLYLSLLSQRCTNTCLVPFVHGTLVRGPFVRVRIDVQVDICSGMTSAWVDICPGQELIAACSNTVMVAPSSTSLALLPIFCYPDKCPPGHLCLPGQMSAGHLAHPDKCLPGKRPPDNNLPSLRPWTNVRASLTNSGDHIILFQNDVFYPKHMNKDIN